MNTLTSKFTLLAAFTLAACGATGADVGEECFDNGDCLDGLECEFHEHDGEVEDHGECVEAEAHDDHEGHDH